MGARHTIEHGAERLPYELEQVELEASEWFGVPDCEATTIRGLVAELQHLIEVLRLNGVLKGDE